MHILQVVYICDLKLFSVIINKSFRNGPSVQNANTWGGFRKYPLHIACHSHQYTPKCDTCFIKLFCDYYPIFPKIMTALTVISLTMTRLSILVKNLSMMYRALWDWRDERATRTSQCTRRVPLSALMYITSSKQTHCIVDVSWCNAVDVMQIQLVIYNWLILHCRIQSIWRRRE